MNTSRKLVNIMAMGLNFAIHETTMAVKPRPPEMLVETVWSVPATRSTPAMPQMAPDRSMVRIITLSTLIPT